MSDYFGDIRLGDTIDIKFTTRQISGAPSTLSGTPVISAYPSNSTTELTAGITLTVDFDARTGYNNVRVVASGGNGYATATNYDLCITTGTVNSVSVVGESIGSFSIENRSALMPTTAALTLDVSATGEAGVDWGNVGSKTTVNDLTNTTIKTTQKVDVDTIKTNPVVNAGTITFPTTATLASTTNITAGTVTTATNLTNAPTAGDFTAAMKTSLNAATPASVVGAVGSVTGAVGSVTAGVTLASPPGIRKNVALAKFEFLMTDSTNHAPVTGKTVTVTRSIDNGAFGAGALSAVTEISNGIYSVDFAAGDLNGGVITLRATAASCDDTLVTIVTNP